MMHFYKWSQKKKKSERNIALHDITICDISFWQGWNLSSIFKYYERKRKKLPCLRSGRPPLGFPVYTCIFQA